MNTEFETGKIYWLDLSRNRCAFFCKDPKSILVLYNSESFYNEYDPGFSLQRATRDLKYLGSSMHFFILETYTEKEYKRTFFGEQSVESKNFWDDSNTRLLKVLTPDLGILYTLLSCRSIGTWAIKK